MRPRKKVRVTHISSRKLASGSVSVGMSENKRYVGLIFVREIRSNERGRDKLVLGASVETKKNKMITRVGMGLPAALALYLSLEDVLFFKR